MKKTLIIVLVLALVFIPAIAQAGCMSCESDEEDNNDSLSVSSTDDDTIDLLNFVDLRSYLGVAATLSSILLGAILLGYVWLVRGARRSAKKKAFKWGLVPAVFFFMQSMFCISLGFLIGCSLSVYTSGFGIIMGVLSSLNMIYILTN